MTIRRLAVTAGAALALLLAGSAGAQPSGEVTLDLLLDRLGTYLTSYEAALATVIADENYQQQELVTQGVPGTNRAQSIVTTVRRKRTLESEVAFLRLPGGSSWFGVRDVRKVDGKPVVENAAGLQRLLERLDASSLREAAAIVIRSSQHNLGGLRTVNMPTVPLEILHPVHHVQFAFKLSGSDRIGGVRTSRLDFEEFDEPTIILSTEGGPMFIKGRAWIEPDNGRLWRVELTVTPRVQGRTLRQFENRMRVDYTPHAALAMMVPKEMSENFWIRGGRGEGRARYANFRQFATSARIVPQ
jgi:hypothetical protein